MPTFSAEAALNGLAWTNLNDTMRLPASLLALFGTFFQFCPPPSVLIWMIQWPTLRPFCAPFPFKIAFFTHPPPTWTHRFAFLKGEWWSNPPLWFHGQENHSRIIDKGEFSKNVMNLWHEIKDVIDIGDVYCANKEILMLCRPPLTPWSLHYYKEGNIYASKIFTKSNN